ncbi:MAG: MBG domain-containing protein, partial [Gallionella sp.]|nr:MBG domain-containing protein [Gallionella sp.]
VGNVNLASAGAVATAGVAGSPYAITASGASGGSFNAGNYSISYVDGALGVTPAPLGIAANSASKIYGDTLSFIGNEFSSTGLKNGETIGGVSLASAGAAATAGIAGSPYAITASAASGGTFSAGNYSISYVDGLLGVIPAGLLGIAANSAAKTYDGLAYSGGNGVNYTGFIAGDTPASLSGTLVYGGSSQGAVNAGNYTIIPSGQSSTNYTITYVNGALSVTPAPLGIAANSATRLYGDANPAFSATYSGFQNGENSAALTGALALSTPAVLTSNVGNYAIVPGGLNSANYSINYVNGNMGVTARPISVSVNAGQTKIYGGTDPALAYSVSAGNLANGDVLALTRLAGENVGGYAISLTPNTNYNVIYTGANFAITPAMLMVVANPQSKVYGTIDPALTYTTGAFQFGDTAGSVLTGVLSRAAGEDVNFYAIGQNTLASNANYTLAYTGNNLGITPAPLHVAAHPQNKLFGMIDPVLTFGVTGLVNNPGLGIIDAAGSVLSGALTRAPGESALGGPYPITQGSLAANSNYTLSFTPSNLVITGAAAEPVLGFSAGQVIFAGVINDDFYYRPGNFWHISLNPNDADPGFDVMRGTNDLKSRLGDRLNRCDSVSGGGFCETWSFPEQREKVDNK